VDDRVKQTRASHNSQRIFTLTKKLKRMITIRSNQNVSDTYCTMEKDNHEWYGYFENNEFQLPLDCDELNERWINELCDFCNTYNLEFIQTDDYIGVKFMDNEFEYIDDIDNDI